MFLKPPEYYEALARIEREKAEEKRIKEDAVAKYLLTTSAEAYVSSVGKKLSDFDLRGVDAALSSRVGHPSSKSLEEIVFECKKKMVEKAQAFGAEVVVDIRPAISYDCWHPVYIIGTALIPKK